MDRRPIVLRTDTTPPRLQEMPPGDQIDKDVLGNALARENHTGALNWAWSTYGGTANAVTLTPVFARVAYAAGDQLRFRATSTNTGATTINVGGLGVKTAVTVTGVALPAGYIRTDVDTVCVYDGTNFVVDRAQEYMENASGWFVREASGVMRCGSITTKSATTSVLSGSGYQSSDLATFVYPALFKSSPVITTSTTYAEGPSQGWGVIAGLNSNGFSCVAMAFNPGVKLNFSYKAEGRWF